MRDCCWERPDCQAPQSVHLDLQIHQLVRFLGQLLLPPFLPPLPLEPQLEVLGVLSWVELTVARMRVFELGTTEHPVSVCTVSGVDHLSRPIGREATLLFPLCLFMFECGYISVLQALLSLFSRLVCLFAVVSVLLVVSVLSLLVQWTELRDSLCGIVLPAISSATKAAASCCLFAIASSSLRKCL